MGEGLSKGRSRRLARAAWWWMALIALWLPGGVGLAQGSDEFIAGYTAAILEHEFHAPGATVDVKDGVVTVTTSSLGNLDRGKLMAALKQIPGVVHAEVREAEPGSAEDRPGASVATIPATQSNWLTHQPPLFAPLQADPRWPQFGAAYRQLGYGLNLSGVFAADFGETFSIYRNRSWFGGEWDFGIQAGVFSVFDVSTASIDLFNADYRVGFLSTYRNGRFSTFLRLYHQSSHLGDEFLLNNPHVTRVDLSYEEVDVKLSYEVFPWLRLYGGVGMIVRRSPVDLGRGTTQWGMELTSARTFLGGRIRPVAYADFQCNERMNWIVNRSVRAGIQFENARIGDRRIQLLGEYYEGRSPDGQFFEQRVGWYGIGVHLYF
jgi:hypothetical protein